jgi:hypothetical protein
MNVFFFGIRMMYFTPGSFLHPRNQVGFFLLVTFFISQLCHGYVTVPATSMMIIGHKIALKSDSGRYLIHRSERMPAAYYQDMAILGTNIDSHKNPAAQWLVVDAGNGKIALQAANGNFLTRCRNCFTGASYEDSATVHLNTLKDNPYATWSVIPLPNGKVALKGDLGKYLARCEDCVSSMRMLSPDYWQMAFVHTSHLDAPHAQWTVENLTLLTDADPEDVEYEMPM